MNLIDFIAKRNNRHFRTDIVITSHNVYYVNSKEGEVMEKSDLIKIEHAIEVVEDYILSYVDCDFDNEFYDVLLLSLKVAYYDMMRCS